VMVLMVVVLVVVMVWRSSHSWHAGALPTPPTCLKFSVPRVVKLKS
jgi:hypothetical protein